MNEIIELMRTAAKAGTRLLEPDVPAIRTDGVYVIFTAIDDTVAAVRVADDLAKAMTVPLTLVHFRNVPFQLPVDAPDGISPVETDAFVARLQAEGFDVRVRVYLCREERRTISLAFRRHSLVVLAGRRRWWPTLAERWRRWLESAGHFVVFVDLEEKE